MAEERRGCVRDQLILFRTRDRKSVPVPKNLPAAFTFDQSRLREAGAVVFHIPEWSWSRSTFEDTPKFPGQLWIAYSMESKVNYLQLADQDFMRHFDLRMTYEQDADIWVPYLPRRSTWLSIQDSSIPKKIEVPYLPRGSTWLSIQGSSIPKKIESHPTALFRSDPIDRCGRNAFAVALMRYTKVDSYGKFLNNRSLAESDLGWSTKLTVISRYHFYLALENSIAPDYVTEKIFDALIAGTIPIYRGAPNCREFVPEGSFIDATTFNGPKILADHLHRLVENPTDYAAYFAWRHKPLPPSLLEKTARIELEPLLQLKRIVGKRLTDRRRRGAMERSLR
jgi:alpha-1,3-fucosyltransferase 10